MIQVICFGAFPLIAIVPPLRMHVLRTLLLSDDPMQTRTSGPLTFLASRGLGACAGYLPSQCQVRSIARCGRAFEPHETNHGLIAGWLGTPYGDGFVYWAGDNEPPGVQTMGGQEDWIGVDSCRNHRADAAPTRHPSQRFIANHISRGSVFASYDDRWLCAVGHQSSRAFTGAEPDQPRDPG
jgi:hypothetical protein